MKTPLEATRRQGARCRMPTSRRHRSALALARDPGHASWRRRGHHHVSEHRLLDVLPIAVVEVGLDRRILYSNRVFQDMLGGMSARPLRGQRLDDLFEQNVIQRFDPMWRKAVSGTVAISTTRPHLADGRRIDMQICLAPVHDRHGRVASVLACSTDITDIRQLERMRSDFVAAINHDLRNPLSAIRAVVGMLAETAHPRLTLQEQRFIDVATESCQRMSRLLNDLLETSRLESKEVLFELQQMSLQEPLGQAISGVAPIALQRSIRLLFQIHDPDLNAYVEPDRLIQATTNLLVNAVKYSPVGSTVHLSIRRVGNHARIEVKDEGPGIREADRQRLFRRFARGSGSERMTAPGYGLGLVIARAIITRMNGRLDYLSSPGEGTTFYYELPLSGHSILPD